MLKGLAELGVKSSGVEEFLVRYARVFFGDYYDYFGMETSLDYVLEPVNGNRKALRLGRDYYLMLLANHSCPRFWENLDTRVSFSNVAVMSKALIELMEHFAGHELQSLFIEAYLRLLNFENLYHTWNLGSMRGLEGWETTEKAWEEAFKPGVPNSGYNVVTRAALYVGKRDLKGGASFPHRALQSRVGSCRHRAHSGRGPRPLGQPGTVRAQGVDLAVFSPTLFNKLSAFSGGRKLKSIWTEN